MTESDEQNKGWLEYHAQFLEYPSRDNLCALLLNHTGEQDKLDFKREWIDLDKVAKHVLAIANSGGGCIIFGVENETHKLTGIDSLRDEADVSKIFRNYIPVQLKCKLHDFSPKATESDELRAKTFQALIIEHTPKYLPFVSKKDSDKGIKAGIVYVRRGTNSQPGNYEEVQEIINKRIETNALTRNEFLLERHYGELRQLYDQLPKPGSPEAALENLRKQIDPNSLFSGDSYSFTDHIKELIERKDRLIKHTWSNQTR